MSALALLAGLIVPGFSPPCWLVVSALALLAFARGRLGTVISKLTHLRFLLVVSAKARKPLVVSAKARKEGGLKPGTIKQDASRIPIMLSKSSHWLWLITIIFLFSLVWIWFSRLPEGLARSYQVAPQIGKEAPDFVLDELGGEAISLEGLRGQPIILNFWASWCTPCRAEMPALEQIAQEYADQGLVILLVNQGESEANIKPFLAEVGVTSPVLLDSNFMATSDYRVNALPTTFFIDKDGRIQDYIIGGPMTEAYLSSRVLSLLETP